jgi:hypothetical protein
MGISDTCVAKGSIGIGPRSFVRFADYRDKWISPDWRRYSRNLAKSSINTFETGASVFLSSYSGAISAFPIAICR